MKLARVAVALQEEVTKDGGTLGSNILDGAALVVVSPVVVPALLLGLRPVAKTFIKGSLFLTEKVKQLAVVTGEGWGDLIAEARSEAQAATAPGAATTMEGQPQQADATSPQGPTATHGGRAGAVKNQPQQTDVAVSTGPIVPDRAATGARAEPLPPAHDADLQGVLGLSSEYAALLKTAGVGIVHELAQCDAAELQSELMQVNDKDHIVDHVPSLEQLTEWIERAKSAAK
jgi:Domain of unknown function (DUF4332)/Protein of unknown function (DUF5132)